MVGRLVQEKDGGSDEQGTREGHTHSPTTTHIFTFFVYRGTAYRGRREKERGWGEEKGEGRKDGNSRNVIRKEEEMRK